MGSEGEVNGDAEFIRPGDMRWLSPLALWTGILAGPAAWGLDLSISYPMVKWACSNQRGGVLRAMTFAALVLVAGGGIVSFIALRRTAGDTPTDGGNPRQRAHFMAILGLTSCALFALAILAGAIPRWVLDACQ